MKTLEQIKDEVAEELVDVLIFDQLLFSENEIQIIDEIAKRYARAALEKAAENALVIRELQMCDKTKQTDSEKFWSTKYEFYQVDKSSITDIELP